MPKSNIELSPSLEQLAYLPIPVRHENTCSGLASAYIEALATIQKGNIQLKGIREMYSIPTE